MRIISTLKVIFSLLLAFMIYKVIDTSLKSNLFEEWSALGQIPWMTATLYDFYTNVFCIFLWIAYKENVLLKKILWLVLLITLGSIGTCLYILKELFMLKKDEDLKTLLVKQNL